MDQSGGCCIARYAGGAYDMSKVDRIMLRFRPIAPKPASNGSSGSATPENSGPSVKTGRGKRRHAAKEGNNNFNKRNNNMKRRKSSPENTDSGGSVSSGEKAVKTLSLLREAPDVKESPKRAVSSKQSFPLWLSFGNGGGIVAPEAAQSECGDPTAAAVGRVVVESWVKVVCVTDTWLVGYYGYGVLGRTDEERVRSLDLDVCPGFVSDGANGVRWTNAAYRRMVAGEGVGGEVEVAAWVAVEDGVKLPEAGCAAFTCRVRVVTCGKEKSSCKTVPCDVWRMDCGGFAWRLDTTAALSLGR